MMSRRSLWAGSIVLATLWAALLLGVLWARHNLNRHRPTALVQPTAMSAPLWDAPPFTFIDQDGHPTTDQSLRGHPYVADFIFTTCTTACPTLTAQLSLLRQKVAAPGVRFVSFSVDPVHDTPAALKTYAEQWGHDDPRWRLLATDPVGLAAVAQGFKVAVAATGDADNPILHSTLFLLVDANGTVRGAYDSTDNDQLDKLAVDLTGLSGDTAAADTHYAGGNAVSRGHAVYNNLGCAACHQQAKVAPPLASVYNGMVRLTDGTTVWADDAYLHESIANPGAKIVAGYLNSMPSYRGHLSDDQTADLVAYVASLSANPPGGHGVAVVRRAPATQAMVAVDPVCHMKVAVNPAGPAATVNGRTFHFCSDTCRDKFTAAPAKYAGELLQSDRAGVP